MVKLYFIKIHWRQNNNKTNRSKKSNKIKTKTKQKIKRTDITNIIVGIKEKENANHRYKAIEKRSWARHNSRCRERARETEQKIDTKMTPWEAMITYGSHFLGLYLKYSFYYEKNQKKLMDGNSSFDKVKLNWSTKHQKKLCETNFPI